MSFRNLFYITLAVFSYAQASWALSQFDCKAQMVAGQNGTYAPVGYFAPTLVYYRPDALKNVQLNEKSLSLRFNTQTLNANQVPYVILDGRPNNLQLNVHVSVKKSADIGVRVNMEDRTSGLKSQVLFKLADSGSSVRLRTNEGSLVLTCYLK